MSAVIERKVIGTDPGPAERFEAVIARADTMGVLVQKLTDGETLKKIAKDWQIPYGRLSQWIVEDRERSEQYSNALRFVADSLAQECVPLADGAIPEDVAVRRLQIDTRLKLAGKYDRARYGDHTKVEHTGSLSLISVLSGLRSGDVVDAEVVPEVPVEKIAEKSVQAGGPI